MIGTKFKETLHRFVEWMAAPLREQELGARGLAKLSRDLKGYTALAQKHAGMERRYYARKVEETEAEVAYVRWLMDAYARTQAGEPVQSSPHMRMENLRTAAPEHLREGISRDAQSVQELYAATGARGALSVHAEAQIMRLTIWNGAREWELRERNGR
jgi:hypothetical protein